MKGYSIYLLIKSRQGCLVQVQGEVVLVVEVILLGQEEEEVTMVKVVQEVVGEEEEVTIMV